jgi:SAM-dependent methyltransferase
VTRIGTAWRKLQSSLAHRSLTEKLQSVQHPHLPASSPKPLLHPFDQRHGVDTSGLIGGEELHSGHRNDVFNTAYYGMSPSRFRWIVDYWLADDTHAAIGEYTFIDLGCGKGRALMLASEFAFRKVIGVELHPGLAKIARQNLAIWKSANQGLCPMQVIRQDATEFVFPPGPCLLYLFHPFDMPVVKRLIERIETQFAARPGRLDLIYFNPESGDLFDSHPGFELLWRGAVPMSQEDTAADNIASPEDLCGVYRWLGLSRKTV